MTGRSVLTVAAGLWAAGLAVLRGVLDGIGPAGFISL